MITNALLVLLALAICAGPARSQPERPTADLIVYNAKITTLDETNPQASALAVRDGVFLAVGSREAVLNYRADGTRVVDAGGRRIVPGLNDSHLHATRGGRFFALELRWDGVDSLERGLAMIAEQAEHTPPGEWVRVIGGWSPFQFEERRMPTIRELNRAAPDTPTFVLFLYSQGFLNAAAVRALGIDATTETPAGARYEFIDGGVVIHAEPNPGLLYQTIGALPGLSAPDQLISAMHFYHELNRFGITSAIDAGGGGHDFPTDYQASRRLAESGDLPVRISYFLFPQEKGSERKEFSDWMAQNEIYQQFHHTLGHGYELEGGGEFLVWSAGDFENFMAPRPNLGDRGDWQGDLADVTTLLVDRGWPLRIHATYGESIGQILDVFESVRRDRGRFAPRWAIDHAETATAEDLERIKSMGGGISIQNRMMFAGEYFADRYGKHAAAEAPPVRKMLDLGIPVAAGTDATRVSSYNPWLSIYWLVTGKTMGGMQLFSDDNKLTREEALRLWTHQAAWFSQEENVKGRIAPGQYADFAVLNDDYFEIPAEEIRSIEAVLTVVGGKPVYGAGDFAEVSANPNLPAIKPDWSPVGRFGGYQR